MNWKISGFIFILTLVYRTDKVKSCQPPLQGAYNRFSHYYSPSGSQQYEYQHQQQPSFQYRPESNLNQYSETSAAPSFLQDNSVDDNNPLFENKVIKAQNEITPPPDPPSNLFGLSHQKEEMESMVDLAKLAEQCMINGAQTLDGFRTCTESYTYSLEAKHAQFGSNKCDFEPEFVCRFYSSPHEIFKFKTGQFRVHPKSNRVFEETFAIMTGRPVGNVPDQTFIFLDVPSGSTSNSAGVLKTDITCQKKDGRLSFDYWCSDPNLALKVCTRTNRERSCTQDIKYDPDVSRIDVDVIKPVEDNFSVEIIVSNFVTPGIFILDNLEYEAELCEDAAAVLGANNNLQQNNIAFGSQVKNIDPIRQDNLHQLYPPSSLFQQRSYGSHENAYVTPPPTSTIPPNPFGPVKPLISFPINGNDSATFTNNQYDGHLAASLPSEITDGVQFVQNRYTQPPRKTLLSKSIKKIKDCSTLECTFESDFCKYSQPEMNGNNVRYGKWQISRTKIGNPVTGIKNPDRNEHNGFAFVGMDQNVAKVVGRTVYILESETFNLEADTLLSFDLYRRSNAITLQVCLDSLMNCPYEAPPIRSTVYWKEGESLIMPQKTRRVYFVATQWKRFKWLAIDNIVINKGRGCHGLTVSKTEQYL